MFVCRTTLLCFFALIASSVTATCALNLFDHATIVRFDTEALDAHNRLRSLHGVTPLTLSDQLSQMAQAEAERFADANRFLSVAFPASLSVGRNLASSTGPSYYDGATLSRLWYESGRAFDYDANAIGASGTFTQLVWASSTRVGFGVARNSAGVIYMVALYSPAGNVVGAVARNVQRPLAPTTPSHVDNSDSAASVGGQVSSSSSSSAAATELIESISSALNTFAERTRSASSTMPLSPLIK